jgi:hypothetical protein
MEVARNVLTVTLAETGFLDRRAFGFAQNASNFPESVLGKATMIVHYGQK